MRHLARAIGPEGALIIVGTCLLAVACSYFSAAGPWFVAGAACVLIAVDAIRDKRKSRSSR